MDWITIKFLGTTLAFVVMILRGYIWLGKKQYERAAIKRVKSSNSPHDHNG